MTEATCRREVELEVPADKVQQTMERIAKDLAKVAMIPGFRPGKAPISLIRRRFADDIKGEVLQTLVPDYLEEKLSEQKMIPVTRPQVDKVDFSEGGPLKFRATFEVLPEFELGNYKGFEVEVPAADVTDADVEQALERLRERQGSFVPVEERAIQDGDFAALKLVGTPGDGGEPLRADNVVIQVGGEDTLAAFSENLRGARPGDQRRFEVRYPDDYPDGKLAGKTYNYAVEVVAVKEKKLPALDDEFAKDVSEATTLEELRKQMRNSLEEARDQRQEDLAKQKILDELVRRHEFPVPEALVEHQMDVRLERTVRSLAAQGVDPRALNVDWGARRRQQRERAIDDVRAELILDRVATAENIEVSDEDLEKALEHMAQGSNESAAVLRARLTKEGSLDRMKSKLRSDKTLDWLYQQTRIRTIATGE